MAVVRAYPNGLTMGVAGRNDAPPPRGDVQGWTQGSVRRHGRKLFSVESESLTGDGLALTLTLRDCPSQEEWARLKKSWTAAVERTPGFVRLHWVVEWQGRGVPHLHVAAYGEGWDTLTGVLLIEEWLRLSAEWRSGWRSQDLKRIDGALGWLRYLSKHAARGVAHYQRAGMPEGWEKTGRLYGFRGSWPFAEPTRFELTAAGYARLRRLVRSWRIADARSELLALPPTASPDRIRAARRRLVSARGVLRSGSRNRSAVRGMSEWCPEPVSLLLHALLGAEGLLVPESAEEARTRVLSGLPSPQEAEAARIAERDDLMLQLGFREVFDDAEVEG